MSKTTERRVLLTEQQVAERLQMPPQSLRNARYGRGDLAALPYFKVGKSVRYSERDLEKFIDQGRRCARDDPDAA